MQTFLPYEDFTESAKVLDYRRLGKQRVEAKQIINAMSRTSGGWVNHPATKMWRGYECALSLYGFIICEEWRRRGYKDQQLPIFEQWILEFDDTGFPPWLGDPAFHASHRSNLLRKDYDFYSKYGWTEPANLEYVWPV